LTRLPKAPPIVLGAIDLHGRVIPVVDLRSRFGLPARALRLTDQLVVAQAGEITVALPVDASEGVEEPQQEVVAPERIACGAGFLEGVFRTAQGLVLIHDLGTLLFPEESRALAEALAEVTA